jgi:opacity protein-like surface antigen
MLRLGLRPGLRPRRNSSHLPVRQTLLMAMSLLVASTHLAHANPYCGTCEWHRWRPFVILGGGVAFTSDLGRSNSFPDPATGGTDIYTTSHGIQTVGAFDSFFGMEWAFHPKWELQIGFGYNQTTSLASNGTLLQSIGTPFANSFSYLYNVVARQYLFEGKLLYNFYEYYHPYVELGLGVSQNAAYGYQTNVVSTSSISNSAPQFPNQTNSSFSYNAGIGIDIDVLNNVRLGLGYRFANFGKVQLGNTLINATPLNGTLSQSHFYVNEALVLLSFVF